MNYRNIFLSALILPSVTSIYSIDARMQQLQDLYLEKQLELSKQGEAIARRKEYIEEVAQALAKDINTQSFANALDEQGKKELLREACVAFCVRVGETLTEKNSLDGILSRELFGEGLVFKPLQFNSFRHYAETKLLKELIRRYEECFNEIIKIEEKLNIHGF